VYWVGVMFQHILMQDAVAGAHADVVRRHRAHSPRRGLAPSTTSAMLERKTRLCKRVLATLKVLWSVIEDMTKYISPEDAKRLISKEVYTRAKSEQQSKIAARKVQQEPDYVHVYVWIELTADIILNLSTVNHKKCVICFFPDIRNVLCGLCWLLERHSKCRL